MQTVSLIIFGDELESALTAVSAAQTLGRADAALQIKLVRRSTGLLGGLSTRGGLSYMDITPGLIPPLMQAFFKRVGFRRVALEPVRAARVLQEMLDEAGVQVLSGVEIDQVRCTEAGDYQFESSQGPLMATHWIDTTPDADIARLAGVPYLIGLGGVLGEAQNFLGVSPVFTVEHVSAEAFRAFEAKLRQRPDLPTLLTEALPYHDPALRAEFVTRPVFTNEGMDNDPDKQDYLDVLNPVIGICYHVWKGNTAASYVDAPIVIDGFNIALLPDGCMGLNGLVARLSGDAEAVFEDLLAYSQGAPAPDFLIAELQRFEQFLREAGGFKNATVIPPEELYVRQTITLLAKDNMTAEKAIRGGVTPERAIGTYSYWLDLRGTQLETFYPGEQLPKPVFNVGLDVALPLVPALPNMAFVSRSAGYSPIGQGVGRIVQHNAMLGEAMGIAAALSIISGESLDTVCDLQVGQIKAILDQRNGTPIELTGTPVWTEAKIQASKLLAADKKAIMHLREQVTLTTFPAL